MIFTKDYGTLTKKSLDYLVSKTNITNQTVGGIARSLLEVINLNISEYYNILDLNTTMGFVSTAEGMFLDLIGDLFNMKRLLPTSASATANDHVQLFYVATGTLHNIIPGNVIPYGTTVSTSDGTISYSVTSDTTFSNSDIQVWVPIQSTGSGSNYNVGINTLVRHSLGLTTLFTTNSATLSGGTDIESDTNYKYRIINASLSAEKANATAVRLAALSTPGVANVIMKPYSRGIGTFDLIVIPVEGLATDVMIANVQSAINSVQAFGMKGYAIKPDVVPVDIAAKLVFVDTASDSQKSDLVSSTVTAIEKYIVNIPIGGTFVYNQLIDRIMNVSTLIKDVMITCYNFREQPTFQGNVSIYWNEMFYPNQNSAQAVVVN
jgi:uncharacterized phage protein gp47/JayE